MANSRRAAIVSNTKAEVTLGEDNAFKAALLSVQMAIESSCLWHKSSDFAHCKIAHISAWNTEHNVPKGKELLSPLDWL